MPTAGGVERAHTPEHLRAVLGHYPSGVTVVTATNNGVPTGFACQSFHALSLDPPLAVLLVGKGSTSWPNIKAADFFAVNVLSETQGELCRAFAKSGADKFAGVQWTSSRLGAPILQNISAWFECQVAAEHDGGDHLIVVARILDLGESDDIAPLIFHRGLFRTISATA
ncbi:flavin reductase family protein [Mycobacterium sp. CBMA226]|nr:flavin reductase family protein [Mycolicibacterium sp. CBMA 226]